MLRIRNNMLNFGKKFVWFINSSHSRLLAVRSPYQQTGMSFKLDDYLPCQSGKTYYYKPRHVNDGFEFDLFNPIKVED